ncbi:MAG: VCBS repeat-containing protein [Armatimonadota bacterium]|nr:VCBS repeat-containing protein [Armatimonadota bacterium]
MAIPAAAVPVWTSPNRYRVLFTVSATGSRSNAPATVDMDFNQLLADSGATGTFDENTVEVVAYNTAGQPKVYDSSRLGHEIYLLPFRIENYYGASHDTLHFVMPDQTYTQYAVYFDTKESGNGRPDRYHGLVGDGDFLSEGYKRREVNANHFDSFCDFDYDGDLDLFKGGTEPFIFCYENVGGNKFVDRGKLANGGLPWTLTEDNGRAWVVPVFDDWDDDGDQDLFASYADGPDQYTIVSYENTTTPGGQLNFTRRGLVNDASGNSLGSNFFSAPTIVDWDNDGKKDIMIARHGLLEFHKNLSPGPNSFSPYLSDGTYVKANGVNLRLGVGRFECVDVDNDGDLDLFGGSGDGSVYWFKNVGTRTAPVFITGRIIAFFEFMDIHSGVKVADFDGDGLLDIVCGRFWERTNWEEQQPHWFGRLYKNVGTATEPRWEPRDANNGSPYTERFQPCDAVRQSGVRAVDWNGDGKTDLIASDSDGFTWFFRNTTNQLFPVFEQAELMTAGGLPFRVPYELRWAGYARSEVFKWDGDNDFDLIVGDLYGRYTLYNNIGTPTNPILAPGVLLTYSNGTPIQHSYRATPLVCDWDKDGKKDLVAGEDIGMFFYKNSGSDASPVLSTPEQITFGGLPQDYPRPNMGSFIDWDNDGKKDLVMCEFENVIHVYKNIGPNGFGDKPVFAADTVGTVLADSYGAQTLSGVDAKDWNGDGDTDILTGQGHGGSCLKFYERDYLDDYVDGTYPTVTVGSPEKGKVVHESKKMGDDETVSLPQVIVTAVFTNYFYAQSPEGYMGIRIDQTGHGLLVGQKVAVTGDLQTNSDEEHYIAATSVIPNGTGTIEPLFFQIGNLGGLDFFYDSLSHAGQKGAKAYRKTGELQDINSLNNIGLLVKVVGKVVWQDTTSFYLDDGSNAADFEDINIPENRPPGVKVLMPLGVIPPSLNSHVAVTAISSCYKSGGDVFRLLRVWDEDNIITLSFI